MIYLSSLLVTFILSYATITWLIMPVLTRYQSLARLINHFDYTALTLILLLTLIIWLFGIQYHLKHFSVIYLYLAFSVYLLLLFMVLFTKTTDFQAISLNPFDFIKADTIYACKIATPNVFSYIEFISLLQKVKKDHRITVNSTVLILVFACYLLFLYLFFIINTCVYVSTDYSFSKAFFLISNTLFCSKCHNSRS